MTEQTFENVVDDIYEIISDLPPALAFEGLTATIMGTAGRCADPHRALLAVIAEITKLIPLMEAAEPHLRFALDDAWKE